MPPLSVDRNAGYDTGTGKTQARSEVEPERTVTAPDLASTSRVAAASESSDSKAVDAGATENKSVSRKSSKK